MADRIRKVVVVGGVAGGMSFAARARRLSEEAEIVVLERDEYVSFANCGLPYYLAGEIPDRASLLLHTPASLAASLALDVRTGHEVVSVDTAARSVRVRRRADGTEYDEAYDALVLSTGATPLVPPIPGVDLPQVRVLRTVPDVDALRGLVEAGARRAVVAGAGFIGLEVAEALRHRGLEVAVVDLADQVLPPLDPEMAAAVERALVGAGVDVRTSTSVTAVEPDDGTPADGAAGDGPRGAVRVRLSDGSVLPADLVLLSVGVRPETTLARAAGLTLGERGTVHVDEHLRTSDPHVYAVGDAVEVVDAVTGAPAAVPLAGPANRQGRAAANHLFGRRGGRTPVLGTAIVRVFDTVAASTGRSEKALRQAGIAHHVVHLHPGHHAGYYPGARALHLKLVFAPDGRVLGAQATGSEGVDKRIDVVATAIRAGMTVEDLAELELAYAPPFGSAKDPVNMAGFTASNVLAGDLTLWRGRDLGALPEDTVLLDARSAKEFTAGHLPGALNIPHTDLRARLAEVPAGVPVRVYCASGFRSYLALRVLRQSGWDDVASLSGGLATFRLERPDVALETGAPTRPLVGSAPQPG
ncbi:FAD-dependent oxidoreductase [Kineosporia sp. A_224]|uniref:FAD-dependent oxidoreductase n=1 Tax=Kineosporia sp. A_224 TaxID=1962180 RepID=UPI000B4BCD05|nr:FAD-dependent oxidoreductase [Kineosporia sp. A_224]